MPRHFSLAWPSACHWENNVHNFSGLCLASNEVPKLHIHSDKTKTWRAHAVTSFHTPVRKAFYLQQCSQLADYKRAVSVPQTFRLPISCSAADILWHLNKKMIEESGDSSQPSSSQCGFLPCEKGCFSLMLISNKKYPKLVFFAPATIKIVLKVCSCGSASALFLLGLHYDPRNTD